MRAIAAGLLCLVLVACASPNVTSSPTLATTPSPAPASTPPSSPVVITHVVITCPVPGPSGVGEPEASPPADPCPAEEAAIYAAVAYVEHTVASMTILPTGFGCASFLSGPVACFVAVTGPAAYVTFVGTAKVAALTLTAQISIALHPLTLFSATVVAFQVPPAGWTAL